MRMKNQRSENTKNNFCTAKANERGNNPSARLMLTRKFNGYADAVGIITSLNFGFIEFVR